METKIPQKEQEVLELASLIPFSKDLVWPFPTMRVLCEI